MADPTHAADGDLDLTPARRSRLGGLVQAAPAPEAPDVRDKAGRQAGMALALLAGGVFWAAVGAAAIFVLRR